MKITTINIKNLAKYELYKALEGYEIVAEEVITEKFDENNELIGSTMKKVKKFIKIDAKDALKILSALDEDFRPQYTKEYQSSDDNEDISLEEYR